MADKKPAATGGKESSPNGSKDTAKKKKVRKKSPDQQTNASTSTSRARPTEDQSVRPKVQKVMETVKSFGFSDPEITAALKHLRDNDEEITFDSLIDSAHFVQNISLEDPSILETASDSYITNGDSRSDSDSDSSYEQVVPSESPGVRYSDAVIRGAIERRKIELQDAIESLTFRCRLCHEAKANILLLPCAHLASCENCLLDVRRCPLVRCNKIVRGTKEVFFV